MKQTAQLPAIYVQINGRNLSQSAVASIDRIIVTQTLCQPSHCELLFVQQNLSPLAKVRLGDSIIVAVNTESNRLFEGDITACEHRYASDGNQRLIIRAYDVLHRLRKRQETRQFANTNLRALVAEVASAVGINVTLQGSNIDIAQSYQWQQSDLAVITENCQRYGYYFSLWGKTLQVFPLSGIKPERGNNQLKWMQNLLDAHVELNTEPACRTVNVFGWNPHRAEPIASKASANAGPAISANTHPKQVGVSGDRIITAQAVNSSSEAKAIGQAMIDQRRMGEAIFQGITEGDAQLRPGTQVNVEGLQDDLNGRYVLSCVNHSFDREHGYLCDLNTTPPPPQSKSQLHSSLGIVIDIGDPDKLGRVKVRFPELGDLESFWLEVTHPGAGHNKGLVALPDVDDHVLVLFVDGDPTRGVVVGGLYGEKGPPADGIDGGKVKTYTFTTPQGQKIQLDDSRSAVRLENSSGSYIDLYPKKVTIHSDTDMCIQ
ncbi:MAG: phage protein D/phage baseplate assembly protein gpV, partial [Cellvibrionaceae bacterium]